MYVRSYVMDTYLFIATSNLISYLTYDTNNHMGPFEGNVWEVRTFSSFTKRVCGQPMKVLEAECVTQTIVSCCVIAQKSVPKHYITQSNAPLWLQTALVRQSQV